MMAPALRRIRDIPALSQHRRRHSGVSLIEVMIALVILAFGMLVMGVAQMQALRQGSAGRHSADAAAVGRTYLEQAHRLPWTTLSAVQGAGWSDPGWAGATNTMTTLVTAPGGGGIAVVRTYGVQWQVTNVAGNTCLRDIEVQVTWTEEQIVNPKNIVLGTRRFNWGGVGC